MIRGLVATPMEDLDRFITGEITNHLFEDRRVPHSGMDLPALNVQRGNRLSHCIYFYAVQNSVFQMDIFRRVSLGGSGSTHLLQPQLQLTIKYLER